MLNRRVLSQRGKVVDEAVIEKFRGSLRGDLIRPGDQGYDTVRKIFSAMIDRRPSLIARCTGLVDVGEMLAGMVMWPLAKGKEVLSFYRYFAKEAPDELNTFVTLLTAPQGGAVVAIGLCYAGSITQGEKVVGPLRAFGPPLADLVRPMAYCEVQRMIDAADPPGLQNYWKSNFLHGLTEAAIESIISHFEAVTSPRTEVIIEHLHGAVSRVGQDETAFNHRDAEFSFLIDSKWADPAESEKHIRWTRDYFSAMEPFYVGGAYINYLGDEDEDRVKAAYGAAKYQRLAGLKNTYDPTNLT